MTGDLSNTDAVSRWMESASDHGPCHMIDWNHVDCVVDIWSCLKLDASLEHSDQEIIRIGDASLRVTQNVARPDDTSLQSSSSCFSRQILRHPLALAVACSKACTTTLEIIFLVDAFASSCDDPFRFEYIMVVVKHAC